MKSLSVFIGTAMIATSLVGIGLAHSASAASDSGSTQVVIVCGPNNAVQIVAAEMVPVGCHVSTVNKPPASRM
jgi:hypothetical protein